MARDYTTILDQTIYDIAIQQFGGVDDIDEAIRQFPDLNNSAPFATAMSFSDTDDELARRFDFNDTLIATGIPPDAFDTSSYSNDYSSDYN